MLATRRTLCAVLQLLNEEGVGAENVVVMAFRANEHSSNIRMSVLSEDQNI